MYLSFLINVSLFILVDFLFQDMPESEKHKEEERLKEVEVKYQTYMEKIKEARCRAQKSFFVVTKLERLSLESLSQTYLIFVSETGAYPSGATQSGLFKHYTRLERLAGESALAYLVSLSVTKKTFYNADYVRQCYETFFSSSLTAIS